MLLQTVRPNIVQAIRAYRVEDLMQAAEGVDQDFLYANLSAAQTKQDVLDRIAAELDADPTVVATGGLSGLIGPLSIAITHIEPWLTLHGLRLIYEKNQ